MAMILEKLSLKNIIVLILPRSIVLNQFIEQMY